MVSFHDYFEPSLCQFETATIKLDEDENFIQIICEATKKR